MMMNPSNSDPVLSSASADTDGEKTMLYATRTCQVFLQSVPAGGRFQLEENSNSCWLVVSGRLSAADDQQRLPGQRLEGPLSQWQNTQQEPACLLAVLHDGDPAVTLVPPVTEERPWGSFTVLRDEPAYKLKQLMVTPGNRLSMQRHQKREEHWLVLSGAPQVTLDDTQVTLRVGQYIHIPKRAWHRITNPAGGEPVEIIELQLGEYFGEDDIERRQDDYGRA